MENVICHQKKGIENEIRQRRLKTVSAQNIHVCLKKTSITDANFYGKNRMREIRNFFGN